MKTTDRLIAMHLHLRDLEPGATQAELIDALTKAGRGLDIGTIDPALVSRMLSSTPDTNFTRKNIQKIDAYINAYLLSFGDAAPRLEDYINRMPDYKKEVSKKKKRYNLGDIPSLYSGVWIGIHYATKSLSSETDEPDIKCIRTFLLFYRDRNKNSRRYEIFGPGTHFTGYVEFRNNILYYYGTEITMGAESAFIVMGSFESHTGEQHGVMSGLTWDDVKGRSYIFSTKLMMKKPLIDEDPDSFYKKINEDTILKDKWCQYFDVGQLAAKTDSHSRMMNLYYESFTKKSTSKSGVNHGDRLFVD